MVLNTKPLETRVLRYLSMNDGQIALRTLSPQIAAHWTTVRGAMDRLEKLGYLEVNRSTNPHTYILRVSADEIQDTLLEQERDGNTGGDELLALEYALACMMDVLFSYTPEELEEFGRKKLAIKDPYTLDGVQFIAKTLTKIRNKFDRDDAYDVLSLIRGRLYG